MCLFFLRTLQATLSSLSSIHLNCITRKKCKIWNSQMPHNLFLALHSHSPPIVFPSFLKNIFFYSIRFDFNTTTTRDIKGRKGTSWLTLIRVYCAYVCKLIKFLQILTHQANIPRQLLLHHLCAIWELFHYQLESTIVDVVFVMFYYRYVDCCWKDRLSFLTLIGLWGLKLCKSSASLNVLLFLPTVAKYNFSINL